MFFVYGGQLLHSFNQAEPATVNNKQNNSANVSLLSVIKTRSNNCFCFYSKYLNTYSNCCKICMQKNCEIQNRSSNLKKLAENFKLVNIWSQIMATIIC